MPTVRTITQDEVPAYQELLESAFGGALDPESLASWRPMVEPDRTHAAYDGGEMVGTAAVFTFDMTVPGGPLHCAGVTGVSVAPTHRRQGVLTAMMQAQLDAVRERGTEPFAALWSSEAPIYGRYGYGIAGERWHIMVSGPDPVFLGRPPAGRVRRASLDELQKVAPDVYDTLRVERPGMISRSPERWTSRLDDLPANRQGGSEQRIVMYDDPDGRTTGYALYRTKPDWHDAKPQGTVRIKELIAAGADAHWALWRYLLGIDLMRSVEWDNAIPDSPILWRLRDRRAAKVNLLDGVYVRLLDVPAALTARRYTDSGRVTIEVRDTFGGYAEGCWTLDATADGATCTPATGSPDLTMSAADLGASYLGAMSLLAMYDAGRVDEHTPGAAVTAARLLRWDRGAWCPEIF